MANFIFIILIIFVTLSGCGSDKEEKQTIDRESNLLNGWQKYATGDYSGAILVFENVLHAQQTNSNSRIDSDAYNGLGWAYMGFSQNVGVNQSNISISLSKFQEAIARDNTNLDAYVGQATALIIRRRSNDDFRNALKSIDDVLANSKAGVGYLYRHDYNSEADLHALKAQCYYYLDDMQKANDEAEQAIAIEKDNETGLSIKILVSDQ